MAQHQTQPTAADRQRIDALIIDKVNLIWRYTRQHAGSLDSERHTANIRAAINLAVDASTAFYRDQLENLRSSSKGDKTRVRELQAEVKLLKHQLESLRESELEADYEP